MLIRNTFFLLLTAISFGNVLFFSRPANVDFSTEPSPGNVEAIAANESPFTPKDKGEPDSTMTGTSRFHQDFSSQHQIS